MITLYDSETGQAGGTITPDELLFLMNHLEEESIEDKDYYINRDTIVYLEEDGAQPHLAKLLRQMLGDREDMDIYWSSK